MASHEMQHSYKLEKLGIMRRVDYLLIRQYHFYIVPEQYWSWAEDNQSLVL